MTWRTFSQKAMILYFKRMALGDRSLACLWLAALVCGMLACASCRRGVDEHSRVRAVAQQYYDSLLAGNYQGFVAGMAGTAHLPQSYRQQLVDMVAQHAAEMKSKGGMAKAVATRDSLMDSIAYVFLDVTFGDSTVEQVGVKMVREGDDWKMR